MRTRGLGQTHSGVAKRGVWGDLKVKSGLGSRDLGSWLNKMHGILRVCGMLTFLESGWKTWSIVNRTLVLFGFLDCYRGMCAVSVAAALVSVPL